MEYKQGRPRKPQISTHAPLAGRDIEKLTEMLPTFLISTHAPLAGRDDRVEEAGQNESLISTHAPLAGRDERPH